MGTARAVVEHMLSYLELLDPQNCFYFKAQAFAINISLSVEH